MADGIFENERVTTVVTHPNWGAIWGGVFTFIAIWSIFGLLGMAIFASSANPGGAHPVTGMGVGISIWSVVLTIIAMFFAGLVTGQLAGVGNARAAVQHGMIMFGLSVVSFLVIAVLGTSNTIVNAAGGAHSPYILTLFADLGWAGFVSLFLGWLAAMGGASTGIRRSAATVTARTETRQAA